MEWRDGIKEMPETERSSAGGQLNFDKKTLEKYDKILGDDTLDIKNGPDENAGRRLSSDEIEQKYNQLFDSGEKPEKEQLREQTGWSDEVIDAIGSKEESEIYKEAGLKDVKINGKECLIREDIDPDLEDEDGITNRERMERGRPPVTNDGEEIELHHIGQKQDSPLAELTMEQHRGAGNDTILHDKTKETEIDRNEFAKERREHWKDRAQSNSSMGI